MDWGGVETAEDAVSEVVPVALGVARAVLADVEGWVKGGMQEHSLDARSPIVR